MIQLGHWTGQYRFENEKLNKIRGFEKTFFEVEILTVNDKTFTGRIWDDLATGGTEGVGEILGKIMGDRIDFVKFMPVMNIIVDSKGTIETYNRKHRPIYYTGQFSSDGETVSGTWRFKLGIIWVRMLPSIVLPLRGFWSMTRKK